MVKSNKKSSYVIVLALVIILLSSIFIPVLNAKNLDHYTGIVKGPSYLEMVPLEKVTFVEFDNQTYLDDYAYLAALPTAVFKDQTPDKNRIFSHPLIYYQDKMNFKDDKYRSLDAYVGIEYFMEDWMDYCNDKLDQITMINVDKTDLDNSWKADKFYNINCNDPSKIASDIALHDWSYSDDAVVAIIDDEFEDLGKKTSGTIKGSLKVEKDILTEHFEVTQTNKLNPVFNEFNIPSGYEYVYVRCWYPSISIKLGVPLPGLESLSHITIPAGDKDLQLYCLYQDDRMDNPEWMQVLALAEWNQKHGMDLEKAGTYVYQHGKWRVGVTDVPTKSGDDSEKTFQTYGSFLDILKSLRQVVYQVDIEMYPGEKMTLLEDVPFDCRNLTIELESNDPNANLGFCLIGGNGEKLSGNEGNKIHMNRLGRILPDQTYDLVVYTQDSRRGTYDYEITYTYWENKTEYRADCLSNAVEGSVLASSKNIPLLYVKPDEITEDTIDALLKLGVENLHVVDVNNHLGSKVTQKLKEICKISSWFTNLSQIYDQIRESSGSNDVIFSTIEPWTPWLVGEQKPSDEIETPGAFHIGPAAYIAAHHGTPVLIVENHPELSSATTWHNEFWRRHPDGSVYPSTSEMYLSGTSVYNFLKDNDFDKKGMETIITVCDQYDIGTPWDRVFVGAAKPGRFCGSPVDTSYWIARNVFYPALIYMNPALSPNGVNLINGSSSHRRNIFAWGKGGLVIDRPEEVNNYKFPVIASLIGHKYRLNERMEKYYGMRYQCADGIIPGKTNSFNAIDDGTLMASTGEPGAFWPDMSTTENVPFYLNRGGYNPAFTTSFDATINNLNQGGIFWIVNSHGVNSDGGTILFWDPQNSATPEEATTGYPGLPFVGAAKEPNPWRAYDWLLGSTEEPDTMTSEIYGIIPALLGNPNPRFSYIFRTAIDWAWAKKPIMDKISKIANLPIIRRIAPDWLKDSEDYYDGLIISSLFSKFGCSWYKGVTFDKNLENIHSIGLIFSPCLIANKFFHTTMVRHGSAFQVLDPWATSWYSSFWLQTIPRDLILGDTIGEAYTKGISHVGILYLSGGGSEGDEPQWWWDNMENVCFFGDPDLRPFVPDTSYSQANNWEKEQTLPLENDGEITINGHMPFGATNYPNAKKMQSFIEKNLFIIIILVIIVILLIYLLALGKKRR